MKDETQNKEPSLDTSWLYREGIRLAFIIPIHPRHFGLIENFLAKHDVISKIADVFLVFSSQQDYELFKCKEKINKIILNQDIDTKNIVTFKKFYALEKLKNSKYDYFIVCDAEIDVIIKNFNEKNVINKIESLFNNKKIYAGFSPSTNSISRSSASVFLDDSSFFKLKNETLDFNLYYWFSDIPVYRRSDLCDFFDRISYEHVHWGHFDHKIYLNYMILHHGFKIVNFTPSMGIGWSLEYNDSTNLEFLKSEGYGFGWITPRMFRINKDAMLQEGSFLLYHTDRFWGDYRHSVYDASYEDIEVLDEVDVTSFDVYSMKFDHINELINHFENQTYASMVSIDNSTNTGYFKINYENVYESNIELHKKNNSKFTTIKRKNKENKNSFLICTYIKHKNYFIELVDSIYKNVKSKYSINVVFSSIEEAQNIMKDVNYNSKNFNVFVYNVDYANKNHFNYQSSKKFFGLTKTKYDYCMILDSDFSFVADTDLEKDILDYKDLMIKNVPDIAFDRRVAIDCNSMLDTKFGFFPLELPWIVDKNILSEMFEYFLRKNIDLTNLNTNKNIFEIILYRYYLCKYHNEKIKLMNIPWYGFIFDRKGNVRYKYAENKLVGGGSDVKMIIHKDR